ncbi:type III secretion inner membrane ring lipoprotein SctJ [Dyella sp.]|jgi:type III secretion protein J|uniref:type III secretion system inner membrane ring lipoprotein SctJ n=1 Tax=Dyella sp. TaxID=1869338 RepID=UPI002FDA1F70
MKLIIALLVLFLAGCGSSFREGLDEAQANDIIVLLGQQGIKAKKMHAKDGSWDIQVSSNERVFADQIIQAYDRPRNKHPTLGDVFPGGGLLPSEAEIRIRYQYALSQELSQSIEKIEGVLSSYVNVAIPEKDPKQATQTPPSAAAVIRYRSDQRIDLLKPQIKALIAGSLPGGATDDVSLLMVPVYPVSPTQTLQEVQTHAGLRYRASEWMRVVVLTGLPWMVAFALILVLLRMTGKRNRSWWSELSRLFSMLKKRLLGGRPSFQTEGGSGSTYASKGLSGLTRNQKRENATDSESSPDAKS